jgi:hypothetical protein
MIPVGSGMKMQAENSLQTTKAVSKYKLDGINKLTQRTADGHEQGWMHGSVSTEIKQRILPPTHGDAEGIP